MSRAKGMADAQIKELLTTQGGWSGTDVDQAFSAMQASASVNPSMTPTPMMSPTITPAVAATGMSTGKIISIIVVIAVLAGGGGYYYLSQKNASSNIVNNTVTDNTTQMPVSVPDTLGNNPNTTSTTNTTSPASVPTTSVQLSQNNSVPATATVSTSLPFHCKDLVSEADYQKFISGSDNSTYQQFLSSESYDNKSGMLGCHNDFAVALAGFYTGWYTGSTQEAKFESMVSTSDTMNVQMGLSPAKKINGIGTDAYITGNLGLTVLSTNQKYIITIGGTTAGSPYASADESLAKIIDANLSKY